MKVVIETGIEVEHLTAQKSGSALFYIAVGIISAALVGVGIWFVAGTIVPPFLGYVFIGLGVLTFPAFFLFLMLSRRIITGIVRAQTQSVRCIYALADENITRTVRLGDGSVESKTYSYGDIVKALEKQDGFELTVKDNASNKEVGCTLPDRDFTEGTHVDVSLKLAAELGEKFTKQCPPNAAA
jgi:hypothetical protein